MLGSWLGPLVVLGAVAFVFWKWMNGGGGQDGKGGSA